MVIPRSIRTTLMALLSALFLVGVTAGPAIAWSGTGWHADWAKMPVFEQFGVTATEVYIHQGFYGVDETSVSNQYEISDSYCYNSSFPGWSLKGCGYSLNGGAPYTQAINISGHWTNAFCGCDYTQYADAYARWYDWSDYDCGISQGSLPSVWSFQCSNGETS